MFRTTEIKKNSDPISFDKSLDIKDLLLKRQDSIIDIKNVRAKGQISYENHLFLLTYDLDYQIVLPSSRSMVPVELTEHFLVTEVFSEEIEQSYFEDDSHDKLILSIETDIISLEESVIDNILLNIPLKVLTEDEEKTDELPSGENWSVLTEEQYQALKTQKKKENNPFTALEGLFDDD
ncbi:YceD family protein [Streptococcus marimammalium]|uniref:YceD family protein n=1 Tax=Streptococcus marimammalium TaxID=269666 RepID=UPI00036F1027|nr:YceD family protein [Streptococcus marimammalium]